jgi:tRNA(adenine34) deaminase
MAEGEASLSEEVKLSLMREALAEARRGMAEGEAPIGCVIALPTEDGAQIVGRGHNRANALSRKTAHAEIVAFENAGGDDSGGAPTLPLDRCDAILVSTLEPCVMCLGAAMESGVQTVIFGLEAPADNGTRRVKPPESAEATSPSIEGGILSAESRALFVQFLRGKEGTPQGAFVEQLLALTDDH